MRIEAMRKNEKTGKTEAWSLAEIEPYLSMGWSMKTINGYVVLIKN